MLKILVILSLLFTVGSFAQQNNLTGKVYDSKTREPLTGVNIIINELKGIGASTDIDGVFKIRVPAGSYSVTATFVGYRPVVKTDIIVTAGNEASVAIFMQETQMELNQVTIQADYFDKAALNNNISAIALGADEILRSPGAAQDFFRILQGLAGVSFSNDQKNELVVRGGSPNENLIIFDNMEIHSTNHFPSAYNSAGRINMVNLDLVEDIQFSTGGFVAKFGDKLSSVVNINNREGTRNYPLKGNLNFSMQSFGSVMEGSIDNGKGAWIFSLRKSYLDLIKTAVGLNTVPEYWDSQFKLSYDLSNAHKISCTGLFGYDKVFDDGESDDTFEEKANTIDSTGRSKSEITQSQAAVGINLKSFWSKNLYSVITMYYSNFHTMNNTTEDFVRRTFNNSGEETNCAVLNRRPIFVDTHDNGEAVLSTDFIWNINNFNELNFGIKVGTIGYTQDLFTAAELTRYKTYAGWQIVKDEAANPVYNIKFFESYKTAAFVNYKISLLQGRLSVNTGLRYDYFSYNSTYNISPRISSSFYIIPGQTSFNFAYGEYYQTQLFPIYTDKENSGINRNLQATHARHFVAGFEQILANGLKLSAEGYYKIYNNIPVTEKFINYYNHQFRSNKRINAGKQYTMGLDILLQQKLVDDLYGTVSWSLMKSETEDPRIGREGERYPSDYDFPNVFTLIVGKRFNGVRSSFNTLPGLLRYLFYLLPFSDDMEISLRWRYAAGKPYTPMVFKFDEQVYEGETRWSRGSWADSDNINSERYPAYHRLDISLSSRFNFYDKNLSVYLTVENLYNRKNIAGFEYNSDGTVKTEKQFSLMPVAGILFEF